jgi:hypothetical protein
LLSFLIVHALSFLIDENLPPVIDPAAVSSLPVLVRYQFQTAMRRDCLIGRPY